MTAPRLMIVDDDPEGLSTLQAVLKSLGYEVTGSAATGEDAVRLAESTLPDLILMDIELGGKMDGTEAAEIIHDRLQVPIIFLSAYSDERIRRRAKKSEPFGYLLKPYNPDDLRVTIETALDNIRLSSRLKASREQYRRLIEDYHYVFLAVDRDGILTYASPPIEHPIPADYSGGGAETAGIYRPETGLWALRGITRFYFGGGADWPRPADYSGSGPAAGAVYRPRTGLWAIRGLTRIYWGGTDYIPLSR